MHTLQPLVTDPRLHTVLGTIWPRRLDEERFPVVAKLFSTAPDVRVLVHSQFPEGVPRGEFVLVHGLEGSSQSGYMKSMAQAVLEEGFAVHRFNLRTCGGTEFMAPTSYHAGQTSDLFCFLMDLDRQRRTPVYLVGFSLGGNVVLKLAGEMGEDANRLLGGVCAVSAPIDLLACAHALMERENRLYQWWFLRSLRRRVRMKEKALRGLFPVENLDRIGSIYEFDDVITAPHFGFRDAKHYYTTQSAQGFLKDVRVPALLIQSRDDPMVPFGMFAHPSIKENSDITLHATSHGGHSGFLSRRHPRFWLDRVILGWMMERQNDLRTLRVS